ncbi:MAG TPA: hypothetical protein VD860_08610 [Azospirillum sp.]|nr:hypothetical protein [Azospirillum sp.]
MAATDRESRHRRWCPRCGGLDGYEQRAVPSPAGHYVRRYLACRTCAAEWQQVDVLRRAIEA